MKVLLWNCAFLHFFSTKDQLQQQFYVMFIQLQNAAAEQDCKKCKYAKKLVAPKKLDHFLNFYNYNSIY